MPPEDWTLSGLCVYMGTFRDYLYQLQGDKPEFYLTIKRIREIITENYEQGTKKGKINAAFGIFMGKNLGYTDKQDVDLNVRGSLDLGKLADNVEEE